jgi:hypothetical protein
MAEIFQYVAPHPLLNPREPMGRGRGGWNPTASAAQQWERGDLVEVNATTGFVNKCVQTTPANILRLAFAAAPYDIGPLDTTRYGYYTDRGVPLDALRDGHLVVFTYQDATADGSDDVFQEGDLAAVRAQASRELKYNTAEEVLTIRNGSTNPNVKMKYVFRGEPGDSNVQVACEILPTFRYEV